MSAPTLPAGRLGRAPVVQSGDQWWLVSEAGSVLTDPAFSDALHGFAVAMAAADQAVAGLHVGGRR